MQAGTFYRREEGTQPGILEMGSEGEKLTAAHACVQKPAQQNGSNAQSCSKWKQAC